MKNRIEDLRGHLFSTIEALSNKDTPMEIGRAKAIAEVAQVIINSAKVEVAFIRATDKGNSTGFISPGNSLEALKQIAPDGSKDEQRQLAS